MTHEIFGGVRGERWEHLPGFLPNQAEVRSTVGPSGNLLGLNGDSSFQSALWRVFEAAGEQVVFTFEKETRIGTNRSPVPSSTTGVIASVRLPFGWEELVAQVSSMRSQTLPTVREIFRFGDASVDFSKMEVSRPCGRVQLTAQEFKTLKFFLTNPDRVISRDELLNEAWGYDNYPCTRTVDNHILRLRQKLEIDPANPVHFQTVIRVGYRFTF